MTWESRHPDRFVLHAEGTPAESVVYTCSAGDCRCSFLAQPHATPEEIAEAKRAIEGQLRVHLLARGLALLTRPA